MGLGRITRGGGKVAAAVQVGLLLFDLGGAIVRRLRGRSKDQPPERPSAFEQADAGGGDQHRADRDLLHP